MDGEGLCNFLLKISTLSQAVNLNFVRHKFGKKTAYNLQTEINF